MPTKNAGHKYFAIGHVHMNVMSNQPLLLDLVGHWIRDFEVPMRINTEHAITVALIGYPTTQALPFKVPEEAKLTFENGSAKYYHYRSLWLVDFGQLGIMIVNRTTNKITGFVYHERLVDSEWHFEDFMHPLYELLRQKELYPHHAAAVSRHGHGLLLAGKSGQGKTTLSIDLVNHGFNFLSDDRCFVREQNDHFEMFGFYEPFKVFSANVAHIPTLSHVPELPKDAAFKGNFDMRHYYPEQITLKSDLKGIIFPAWFPNETSRLEFVTPGKALIELLPLTMVCFDAASSKAHFGFAGRLLGQLPAAKLIMGNDRENWHQLILDFMSQSRRR